MFSDHPQDVTWFPRLGLMMLAAGLVAFCQLLAMALVGDSPRQNTSVRDRQRVALADCVQRSTWATRHECIRESQRESADQELVVASWPDEQSASIKSVVMEDEGAASDRADILHVAAAQ